MKKNDEIITLYITLLSAFLGGSCLLGSLIGCNTPNSTETNSNPLPLSKTDATVATAPRQPFFNILKLANQPPSIVETVLGKPFEVDSPTNEHPEEWRGYHLKRGAVLRIQFYKKDAQIFMLTFDGGGGASTAERAIADIGLEAGKLTLTKEVNIPGVSGNRPALAKIWEGSVDGVSFDEVTANNQGGESTFTFIQVEVKGAWHELVP